MGQTFYDDTYAGGHTGATDLSNIETNFATLKSLFSGTSAPGTTVAGMPFFDTNNDVLKVRNAANNAWRGMLHSDGDTFLILCYRNDAPDGYTIDTSLTSDRVVAVKNHGSGTFTTAGAAAGSWNHATGLSNNNESSHTHSHYHKWYDRQTGFNDLDGGGNAVTVGVKNDTTTRIVSSNTSGDKGPGDMITDTVASAGSAHTHTLSSDSSWRPYAYVFIIIYIDGLT